MEYERRRLQIQLDEMTEELSRFRREPPVAYGAPLEIANVQTAEDVAAAAAAAAAATAAAAALVDDSTAPVAVGSGVAAVTTDGGDGAGAGAKASEAGVSDGGDATATASDSAATHAGAAATSAAVRPPLPPPLPRLPRVDVGRLGAGIHLPLRRYSDSDLAFSGSMGWRRVDGGIAAISADDSSDTLQRADSTADGDTVLDQSEDDDDEDGGVERVRVRALESRSASEAGGDVSTPVAAPETAAAVVVASAPAPAPPAPPPPPPLPPKPVDHSRCLADISSLTAQVPRWAYRLPCCRPPLTGVWRVGAVHCGEDRVGAAHRTHGPNAC